MNRKNREIESLRAVAIVLTLAQHLPILLPWPDPPGWLKAVYDHVAFWGGVDLFFVISGFVVTQSLLNAFDGNRTNPHWTEVKRFWVRRAFRLFPLAWLWVGIVLVLTLFFNDSRVFGTVDGNSKQALRILLYVYNWFAYGLHASGIDIAALGVYWSLATEEQFYLLLPLLLLFLKPRYLLITLAIAIAAQFFISRPGPWMEQMWGLRFDALAWGVLLAFLARRSAPEKSPSTSTTPPSFCWLANILLLAGILILPACRTWSVATGLLAVVCMLYVWLARYERGYVLPVGATGALRSSLDWLGAHSYAIYVIHVPAFMLCREITFRISRSRGTDASWDLAAANLFAGLILTLVCASVCHRFLEQPLRDFGRTLSQKIN